MYQNNFEMTEQTLDLGVANNFEVRNHPFYHLTKARSLNNQGLPKMAIPILKQTILSFSKSTNKLTNDCLIDDPDEFLLANRLSLYLELAESHWLLGELVSFKKFVLQINEYDLVLY